MRRRNVAARMVHLPNARRQRDSTERLAPRTDTTLTARRRSDYLRLVPITAAGWSSQVAREAHNLEVGGSNPPPAMFEPRPGRALDGRCGSGARASDPHSV